MSTAFRMTKHIVDNCECRHSSTWREARDEITAAEAALHDAREHKRLLHTLLQAAWDELEAAEEHHRWHHEQEGRDVEPREERLELLLALGEALDDDAAPEPFAAASDVLAATLRFLASHHHRTLTPSQRHYPERFPDFEKCPCLTCRKAAAALRIQERAVLARAGKST